MRCFLVRNGLLVLWWWTLWYPAFAVYAGLWLGYRALLIGISEDYRRMILALLFLFLPLAGDVQAVWLCNAWNLWKEAVCGSRRAFAAYAATALAPMAFIAWWLRLRVWS
jgi:hypothetical protein